MNDTRWKIFADIIAWARVNAPRLQETVPILPSSWVNGGVPHFVSDTVMPREVYGYAHCTSSGGLVLLRNPWIHSVDYALRLDESIGLGSGASGLSVVSLYPEVRVYGEGLNFGDTLSIPMARYETVVLSIGERRSPAGLEPAAPALAGLGSVNVARNEKTRVEFTGVGGLDGIEPVEDTRPTVRLLVEAAVEVCAPNAELVVLAEASIPPTAPTGRVLVNGVEREPSVTCSETGWSVTNQSRPENWVFLRYPLSHGTNAISVELCAGTEPQTLSVWVLSSKPGNRKPAAYPNALPQPEEIYLESAALVEPFATADVTG